MLTANFQDAALFLNPDRARAVAERVAENYQGVSVSKKIRRLRDRCTVEQGFAVSVFDHGIELFLSEAGA